MSFLKGVLIVNFVVVFIIRVRFLDGLLSNRILICVCVPSRLCPCGDVVVCLCVCVTVETSQQYLSVDPPGGPGGHHRPLLVPLVFPSF